MTNYSPASHPRSPQGDHTHTYKVTWPITNPDMPLNELRAEAIDCLRLTAATHGWTYTSIPTLHIKHGAKPELSATVNVRVNPTEVAA